MKLLTNLQAKRLDRIALKKHSRTGHSLMKNAGRCVSNLAISLLRKVQNPENEFTQRPQHSFGSSFWP